MAVVTMPPDAEETVAEEATLGGMKVTTEKGTIKEGEVRLRLLVVVVLPLVEVIIVIRIIVIIWNGSKNLQLKLWLLAFHAMLPLIMSRRYLVIMGELFMQRYHPVKGTVSYGHYCYKVSSMSLLESVHRGVAFIEFALNEEAEKAKKHMNKVNTRFFFKILIKLF